MTKLTGKNKAYFEDLTSKLNTLEKGSEEHSFALYEHLIFTAYQMDKELFLMPYDSNDDAPNYVVDKFTNPNKLVCKDGTVFTRETNIEKSLMWKTGKGKNVKYFTVCPKKEE